MFVASFVGVFDELFLFLNLFAYERSYYVPEEMN